MKRIVISLLFFIVFTATWLVIKFDFNISLELRDWVDALLIGYATALIVYNWDGFFKHHIRKLFDGHYRSRSEKGRLDRKYRFILIPGLSLRPARKKHRKKKRSSSSHHTQHDTPDTTAT